MIGILHGKRTAIIAVSTVVLTLTAFAGAKSAPLPSGLVSLTALQAQCNQEGARACAALGERYVNGTGIAKDYAKAFAAFSRSCSTKYGDGCYDLSMMYGLGYSVPIDNPKGASLAKIACDLNSAKGCWLLGRIYVAKPSEGFGIEPNPVLAKNAYGKSCQLNFQPACDAFRSIGTSAPAKNASSSKAAAAPAKLLSATASGKGDGPMGKKYYDMDVKCGAFYMIIAEKAKSAGNKVVVAIAQDAAFSYSGNMVAQSEHGVVTDAQSSRDIVEYIKKHGADISKDEAGFCQTDYASRIAHLHRPAN